jgi:hypothetical protein
VITIIEYNCNPGNSKWEGTLVTTRQKILTGLTPENIQAMHIKQESGTMMGKQVLVL